MQVRAPGRSRMHACMHAARGGPCIPMAPAPPLRRRLAVRVLPPQGSKRAWCLYECVRTVQYYTRTHTHKAQTSHERAR